MAEVNAMDSSILKMVEIEGKGRALVTSKPLKGGEIILRDSPILLYSALPLTINNTNHYYCNNCFKALRVLDTQSLFPSCSSCSNVFFCSPNCQSMSSSGYHSPWVCQTLHFLQRSPSVLQHHQDIQVQIRFLVAAYNLAVISPSKFEILLSLCGQPSPAEVASAQLFHSLVQAPPPYASANGIFCAAMSASLLAKDKLNAFGLMEPSSHGNGDEFSRSVRAYGIYPKASLFNHDCLPNACRFDYVDTSNTNNTDLIFRLIHDVPQGREICLSYFPVNETYINRQKRLFEDYGFICDCDRCKVEVNWPSEMDNDNDNDEHESMDEDEDDDGDEQINETDDDFPHSYFFARYMCDIDNCWGTLAPLPPTSSSSSSDAYAIANPSQFLECNVCGNLKKDDEFVEH